MSFRFARVLRSALVAAGCIACSPADVDDGSLTARSRQPATLWIEQQKLVASDGEAADEFGNGVALAGDIALVGVADDTVGTNASQGSARVFTRSGSSWQEGPTLTALDGAASAFLGSVMTFDGTTALFGESNATVGANAQQGAAYVFVRSGSLWNQQPKITTASGGEGDFFGSAVALDGDVAMIGASGNTVGSNWRQGSVHVFDVPSWSERQELIASDGGAEDSFGSAVAVSSDYALIGSPSHDLGGGTDQGAVYSFARNGSTWTEGPLLTASNGATGENFGNPIVVSGHTAFIGAPYATVDGDEYRGKGYVFVHSGSGWTEQQELNPTDGAARDFFGYAAAISGDTLLVGSLSQNDGGRGSVSVFVRSGTTWTRTQKFNASDGAPYDNFGVAVAMSGTTALIGANSITVGSNSVQGAAYVFEFGKETGDPCTTSAECASKHCSDERCCNQPCDGACDACSIAAGAMVDGACALVAAGSPGSPACAAPAVCTGESSACALCVSDAECAATHYCNADRACTPRKSDGEPCDLEVGSDCRVSGCRACASGHCVEGVCCESACDGECEACVARLTDAPDGVCAAIPGGEDPENECEASPGYPEDCLSDGTCSGTRSCRPYATTTTACGDTTCTAGAVSGLLCSGSGQCRDATETCTPYLCDGDACGTSCTSDDDCDAESAYCTERQTCAEKRGNGEPCTDPEQCQSSFCADGVCCESACRAQCEACAEPGSEGRCSAVTGAPRGDRNPCAGDPEACGGQCDGADVSECHYAPATRSCGGSCEDGREIPRTCDGEGACVEGRERACGDYACDETGCRASCDDDVHCADGRSCAGGACVPNAGGSDEPPATDDGGCGCRAAGSRAGGRGAFLAFFALALAGVGRKRRAGARIALG